MEFKSYEEPQDGYYTVHEITGDEYLIVRNGTNWGRHDMERYAGLSGWAISVLERGRSITADGGTQFLFPILYALCFIGNERAFTVFKRFEQIDHRTKINLKLLAINRAAWALGEAKQVGVILDTLTVADLITEILIGAGWFSGNK